MAVKIKVVNEDNTQLEVEELGEKKIKLTVMGEYTVIIDRFDFHAIFKAFHFTRGEA